MRSVLIGTSFILDTSAPTVTFLRVRPSDYAVSSERLVVTGPDGALIDTELLDDTPTTHLRGLHTGQRTDRIELQGGTNHVAYEAVVDVDERPDEMPDDAVAPDPRRLSAAQWWWMQPSRYCRPDELGEEAWRRFGSSVSIGRPPTGATVREICTAVNEEMMFAYGSTTPMTSATTAWNQRTGVCRDFNHIAVSMCRALNIPTRYVFGYLPDIDVSPAPHAMDFSAWFEVLLDGRWWAFDARVNERRIGRIVVARGRDAADVPLVSTLGPVPLRDFSVRAEEISQKAVEDSWQPMFNGGTAAEMNGTLVRCGEHRFAIDEGRKAGQ